MKKYTEGEVLKVLREQFTPARGTTQTQIAARLGFSVQYIQAVLSGSRPLTNTMLDVLGFVRTPIIHAKKGASHGFVRESGQRTWQK